MLPEIFGLARPREDDVQISAPQVAPVVSDIQSVPDQEGVEHLYDDLMETLEQEEPIQKRPVLRVSNIQDKEAGSEIMDIRQTKTRFLPTKQLSRRAAKFTVLRCFNSHWFESYSVTTLTVNEVRNNLKSLQPKRSVIKRKKTKYGRGHRVRFCSQIFLLKYSQLTGFTDTSEVLVFQEDTET